MSVFSTFYNTTGCQRVEARKDLAIFRTSVIWTVHGLFQSRWLDQEMQLPMSRTIRVVAKQGLEWRRQSLSLPPDPLPLRRQRHIGAQIAAEVGVSVATVSRILKRLGLNRLSALEPAEPVRRYERVAPGEIIHIDIKKLSKFNRIGHRITGDRTGQSNTRGVGWEYVHLAIDDHSRLAYSEIRPDEKRGSCLRFLFNALRFFRSLGVRVERVMTDNGSSFRSRRYAKALRWLKIKPLRTKPYTPKTNGKAERFVQTSLREWAYAHAYDTSEQRAAQLPSWLHRYNWHRPHGSIGSKPPISRLALTEDNLLRLHS